MKIQFVKWIDSETADSWTDASEICLEKNHAVSCGFLIAEDETHIVLALNYDPSNDQVNCYIKIPKCAVAERRTLCQIKT